MEPHCRTDVQALDEIESLSERSRAKLDSDYEVVWVPFRIRQAEGCAQPYQHCRVRMTIPTNTFPPDPHAPCESFAIRKPN